MIKPIQRTGTSPGVQRRSPAVQSFSTRRRRVIVVLRRQASSGEKYRSYRPAQDDDGCCRNRQLIGLRVTYDSAMSVALWGAYLYIE